MACEDDIIQNVECKTKEETSAWFLENRPQVMIFSTKRMVDFEAETNYIYEQMVPIIISEPLVNLEENV